MLRHALVIALSALSSYGAYSFTFTARGRTYRVDTQAMGIVFTMSNTGVYEPSVILPSPETGMKYVLTMILNEDRTGQVPPNRLQVYKAEGLSPTFYGLTSSVLLRNYDVDNLCDLAGARTIWDGSKWHIYVQGREGDYRTASCYGPNHVFEAVGTSLTPGAMQWVKDAGTNRAKKVITGTGTTGIGQDQQWFYPGAYGTRFADWPFLTTYNNWGYGNQLFSYLFSRDESTSGWWYRPVDTPWTAPWPFEPTSWYPDVILAGSTDASTLGDPGLAIQGVCAPQSHKYNYGAGIAYFPNVTDWPLGVAPGSVYAGVIQSVSNDLYGQRMRTPRIARNIYGYLEASSGYPKIWNSYIYYTPSQVNQSDTDGCYGYTSWNKVPQTPIFK